jgi:ferric-dicitrate binding protein FerR (iron transport regulator)
MVQAELVLEISKRYFLRDWVEQSPRHRADLASTTLTGERIGGDHAGGNVSGVHRARARARARERERGILFAYAAAAAAAAAEAFGDRNGI